MGNIIEWFNQAKPIIDVLASMGGVGVLFWGIFVIISRSYSKFFVSPAKLNEVKRDITDQIIAVKGHVVDVKDDVVKVKGHVVDINNTIDERVKVIIDERVKVIIDERVKVIVDERVKVIVDEAEGRILKALAQGRQDQEG